MGMIDGGKVLLPGCGSGHDVFALASENRRVVGMDIAETAIQRCKELQEHYGVDPHRVDFRVGDFFKGGASGTFDVIVDYT